MHFFGMSCNLPANEKEKHFNDHEKNTLRQKNNQNPTNHSEKNIRNELRGSRGV